MVRNRKVRKWEKLGDEKRRVNTKIVYRSPFCQAQV